MTRYFIEKLCPGWEGKGCSQCDHTGAVEYEVDSATFYEREYEVNKA
jgi:hypothetical protein